MFADARFVGLFPGKSGATVADLGSDGYIDLISGKRAEEMTTLDPKGAYVFVK